MSKTVVLARACANKDCDQEFVPHSSGRRHRFCTVECARRALKGRDGRPPRRCTRCHSLIPITKRSDATHCSPKCRTDSWLATYRPSGNKGQCVRCGVSLVGRRSDAIYCTLVCKKAALSQLRQARKRASRSVRYSYSQMQDKMRYWGEQCWMCGGPFEHVDHVKPIAAGGPDLLANLRPSCARCNQTKHARWLGIQAVGRMV